MNPENFAEWLRRQGHNVYQTKSSYWYDQAPRVYQAFPYHWTITPADEEVESLLREMGGIALRYSAPYGTEIGKTSYHVILDKTPYDLTQLIKKARYDVRKGLKNVKVEKISFRKMAEEGWQLRAETLERQRREKAESHKWWRKLCLSCKDLEGFEAWAAIMNGRLVASLIASIEADTFSILYQQSCTDFLSLGVNNALTYQVTKEALSRTNINEMYYGLHSLDAPPSVDQFKFRMGYSARPVRQRVVFHPGLSPLVNGMSHALLRGIKQIQPSNSLIAKAEGMVRFYREGKLPSDQQNLPPILEGN